MHGLTALSLFGYSTLSGGTIFLLTAAAIWSLIFKGFALWYSARNKQKAWFVILLIVNTLGILEIIYLIWFRPKTLVATETPAHDSSAQA